MAVLVGKLHELDTPLTGLKHVPQAAGLRLSDGGVAALLPHAE